MSSKQRSLLFSNSSKLVELWLFPLKSAFSIIDTSCFLYSFSSSFDSLCCFETSVFIKFSDIGLIFDTKSLLTSFIFLRAPSAALLTLFMSNRYLCLDLTWASLTSGFFPWNISWHSLQTNPLGLLCGGKHFSTAILCCKRLWLFNRCSIKLFFLEFLDPWDWYWQGWFGQNMINSFTVSTS